MNQVSQLAQTLLSSVRTTKQLKQFSTCLENLAANQLLKQHAFEISSDELLTDNQKATQLSNLFASLDMPQVRDFFLNTFQQHQFWLFDSQRFNRFDEFVKSFQMQADQLAIIYLSSAIPLQEPELISIAQYLQEFLTRQVVISHHVNPDILGGIQIRIDNFIFDYSLKSKFQRFQKKWIDSLNQTHQLLSNELE